MPVKTKINFFPYYSNGQYYDELADIPPEATNITQLTYPDILSRINIEKQIGSGAHAYAYTANMLMPNQKTKRFVVKAKIEDSHLIIKPGQKIMIQSGKQPTAQQRTSFQRDIKPILKLFTPYKITNQALFSKESYALLGSIDYKKVLEFRQTTMLNHPGISYIHKFEYIDVPNLILISEIMDGDVKILYQTRSSDINTSFMLQFQLQTGLALDYCFDLQVYIGDFKPANVLYTKTNNCYHFKISDFDGAVNGKRRIRWLDEYYAFTPLYQLYGAQSFIQSNHVFPENIVFVAWILSFYEIWFYKFYPQSDVLLKMHITLQNENSNACKIIKKYFPFIFKLIIELKSAPFTYYTSEDKTAKFKNTLAELIQLYNGNTDNKLNWYPSTSQ
jgi:hypothetical protein